jgi:hypothetical protein
VSCEGENPADTENIGVINYKPRRGFPAYFFPFKNIEGYQQPLVAVQFEQLKREYKKFPVILYNSFEIVSARKTRKHENMFITQCNDGKKTVLS